jgi:hypothetical protein
MGRAAPSAAGRSRLAPWAILLTAVVCPGAVQAQLATRPVRVAIGFGVDTARSPNREILALYRAYLLAREDTVRPNPYWSRLEQEHWPSFDLLSGYVYQGFSNFTVVHLAPAAGLDSTYLIRALISAVADSTHDVRPLALYRVYATREAGRWVLANALPRLTRTWAHETIQRVTFVYPETHPFDRTRAAASAAFVDSLARAFELTPPVHVDYFFTDDLIATFAAMGLDFFPVGSDTVGGRSTPADQLVFVGSSAAGENYRHELAHVVLQPLVPTANTAFSVMEGLMTWTGGSAGLDFHELLPGLDVYVAAHPDLTLQDILTAPPPREGTLDVGHDSFAVLCEMIYRRGGLDALRTWLRAGREPGAVLAAAARLLDVPVAQLDEVWRHRVAVLAGSPHR